MTTTSPTRPVQHPRTGRFHLGHTALRVLLRLGALIVVGPLSARWLDASADPVGAGLTGFMVSMVVAAAWAFVDGWRHPLRVGAVVWAATSVLYVVLGPLPETLSYPPNEGGWTGLADYLSTVGDGFGFMLALIAVPALVGLGVGQLTRVSLRPPGR